jgi:nucleoside-diphosphate-sugar epimerase
VRVVVTGATGNIGSALLKQLSDDAGVSEVVGIARRVPGLPLPKVTWQAADVARSDLTPMFRGADAVVHLAWKIQPSHRLDELEQTNVVGSRRVAAAAREASVRTVVVGSSVGAYSPGPKDHVVDESWPTDGTPSSFYARHKAAQERAFDDLESDPGVRVVRVRPGLVFQRHAGTEIRRLFAGPLLPARLLAPVVRRVLPDIPGVRFQAVHADDVARAYAAVLHNPGLRGAVNVAADPVLDMPTIAAVHGARLVPLPAAAARAALSGLWLAHLQPSPPGWLDMALAVPLMSTRRMRNELGVTPQHSSLDALADVLRGMCDGSDAPTPPLTRRLSGPLRERELRALVTGHELR